MTKSQHHSQQLARDHFPAISLFSGAMGLDLGLERAGLRTLLAVESDSAAVATIRANRPHITVLHDQIQRLSAEEILKKAGLGVGETFLLAGGPACQSFSTAGKRRSLEDPLGRLFYEFMRIVNEARPRFFLIENVRGILSAAVKHRPLSQRGGEHPPLIAEEELGSAFQVLTDCVRKSGYYAIFDVLNAADFGTAQTRRRLVMFGSRDGVELAMPRPSHSHNKSNKLKPWTTLRDVLGKLPETDPEYINFAPSRRKYFKYIPAGGNWRDLPRRFRHVALGGALNSWGGRTGFFRRLAWEQPSPTLNTHPDYKATALCHPDELRPLSIQEYAKIQGFPNSWEFKGSTREKYRQIGNAVPVDMAEALGRAIISVQEKNACRVRSGKVECLNLKLLDTLVARVKTRLNPPKMRGKENRTDTARWNLEKSTIRNDADRYTPTHLVGAVGKSKIAKRITEVLYHTYGSPPMGNFNRPVDELFFILLSKATTEKVYVPAYKSLKTWIGKDWNLLLRKKPQQLARIISEAGLGNQRAEHIHGIARQLKKDFGRVTLGPLARKPNVEVQEYLTTLPGVGAKTAKCVMLFSMGREVLPVDVHVARIGERVGLIDPLASRARAHEVLEMVVPENLRYNFHVNAIAHGRTVCKARNPQCSRCSIKRFCAYEGN